MVTEETVATLRWMGSVESVVSANFRGWENGFVLV